VIEHNLDVIKCADRVVDLGPEGGAAGGRIVATGTPEEVAKTPGSHTGAFLQRIVAVPAGPVPMDPAAGRVSAPKSSGGAMG
jgi:excinuclease ABC subunit A